MSATALLSYDPSFLLSLPIRDVPQGDVRLPPVFMLKLARAALSSPRSSRQRCRTRKHYVCRRQSCCVAGAVSLSVKEVDLQETLTLLAERHGHQPPDAAAPYPPWLPDEHPLSEVLRAPQACRGIIDPLQ